MLMYVGPDQVVPAMSVLATIMGFVMIFWSKVLNIFRKIFGMNRPAEITPPPSSGSEPTKQA